MANGNYHSMCIHVPNDGVNIIQTTFIQASLLYSLLDTKCTKHSMSHIIDTRQFACLESSISFFKTVW